ncbi:hypothetical protein MBLNU230_g5808t1 [Neophaeotheca triangularis]
MDQQTESSTVDNLPTSRAMLTSLINSINTANSPQTQTNDHEPPTQTQNPLKSSPHLKPIFLTLHVLFPNDLLPALDLLDRGLVTTLIPSPPNQETPKPPEQHNQPAPTQPEHPPSTQPSNTLLYHVRSARPQPSTSRHHPSHDPITPTYEVRLSAWSCSCPAFAFAAFPATPNTEPEAEATVTSEGGFAFGGLARGGDAPVCKHLLACVLAAFGGEAFASGVERRVVGLGELAGWGAGWGD